MCVFLESKRLLLRTMERADLAPLGRLMSDEEIRLLTGEVYPMTEKEMEDFYERNQKTDTRVWFLIIDRESGKIVGETGFLRIFFPWRTSDFSLVLWDRDFWGKGYGKEVAGLMLDYGFHSLNFHRLAIGVVGFNERGLRFWKSVGFVEEGVLRDGYFARGRYSDFVMMSQLESDFRARRGG